MKKKSKIMHKTLKIAAVSTIAFTSLSAVPFNTMASPVEGKIENSVVTLEEVRELVNAFFVNQNPASSKVIPSLTFEQINYVAEKTGQLPSSSEKDALARDFMKANRLLIIEIVESYYFENGKLHIKFKDNRYKDADITIALRESTLMTLQSGNAINSTLNGDIWISDLAIDEEFWLYNTYLGSVVGQKELVNASLFEQEARTAVNNLFEENDPTKRIRLTTDQEAVDAAQKLVDKVTDSTVKAALQKDIDQANRYLDMERETATLEVVLHLFKDGNPATKEIKETTTQAIIDAVQEMVDNLPSSTTTQTRQGLQKWIDEAQELLDAKLAAEAEEQARQNEANQS
ncbi:toxin Cry1Ac domain D-VI-related protein, partial [Listeria rocourtiae]|uniref:toxin Cry1Ac domain D-VI-related protein n=1 Tax=Listeria rocourtiae TaxID=647910 RepID=UPI003D2F6605